MNKCHSPLFCSLFCLALVLSCLLGSANKALPASKGGISVTSAIQQADQSTSPPTGYRIEDDGLGFYYDGVNSVQSYLDRTSGDWKLDTSTSSTRRVYVDFGDPVPNSGPGGSNPTPPFTSNRVPATIVTKAYMASGGDISKMTGLNSMLLTVLSVAFNYNGQSYGVRMNTGNFPETNYALVTCTGVVDPNNPSTSQCNQWKIEPSVIQPDGRKKNVAKLVRVYTANRQTVNEDHGDFYMSFSMSFTQP